MVFGKNISVSTFDEQKIQPLTWAEKNLKPIYALKNCFGKQMAIRRKLCIVDEISTPSPRQNPQATGLIYIQTECD